MNAFSLAGGAVVDTFENDGLLDVVTSSMDLCESLHYFKNKGDGTFVERTAQAGLAEQLGGLNLIQGDYNNDGCMDLLVLRGGWEFAMRKSLLRNNCNGTFTDVTRESGLWNSVSSTQTAVWADIDNDGLLDLFAGSENGPSQLFRNKGDGTFEDISRAARRRSVRVHQSRGRRRTTTTTGTSTSTCRTTTAPISSTTTITIGRSPRSASRRACRRPGAASPPGSSTTTTTAGPISS